MRISAAQCAVWALVVLLFGDSVVATAVSLYGALSFYAEAEQMTSSGPIVSAGPPWSPVFDLSWLTMLLSLFLAVVVLVLLIVDVASGHALLIRRVAERQPRTSVVLAAVLAAFGLALATAAIWDFVLFREYRPQSLGATAANLPMELVAMVLAVTAIVPIVTIGITRRRS